MPTPIIEVGEDRAAKPSMCPHCKKALHMTVEAWLKTSSEVIRSNCPYCNGEVYAAMMIITDVSLKALMQNVIAVTELFRPENRHLINNPVKGQS